MQMYELKKNKKNNDKYSPEMAHCDWLKKICRESLDWDDSSSRSKVNITELVLITQEDSGG